MTHALKTQTEFYEAVDSGEKNFEIRKADRPFKVGDDLLLQDYKDGQYTGRELERRIIYILQGAFDFGLREGFVILGLKELETY